MTNFTTARINMVDSQIHTMGVVGDAILDAYRLVPREEFVPEARKGIAYCDEDMPIGEGRFLMEPVTHARLMQAVNPVAGDTVLDVGGATGYSAAILSRLCARVVAVEEEAHFLARAEQSWGRLGRTNIMPHQGAFAAGNAEQAPYSLIFVNGSMGAVPEALLAQLAPHGRLVCVLRNKAERIGRAMLFVKSAGGAVSERVLFDAAVPYLPGLEPRNEFVF
jgi:protein-L-isoaspartate(D-aspartate) O-methyltransferase